MHPGDANSWHEWSNHVLIELKRLDSSLQEVHNELHEISVEIAMLKVKAGLWGALAGLIPALIAAAMGFLGKSGN